MKLNRLPIMILAIFTLVSAIWGGLLRLGWNLPQNKIELIALHGPLMLCGFFGTVISMERAVASNKAWTYLAPILTGLGALLMLTGIDINLGKYSILLGSLVLLGIFIDVLKIQFSLFLSVMTLGSIFWIIGNILWVMGYPVFDLVIWWQAFLLFTITGERLELARMVNISELSKKIFVLCSSIVLAGLVMSLFLQDLGIRLFSLGIIALTMWLTKNDIARRTVKSKSLTRFIAVSLLSSYFWLGVTGLIGVFFGASIIGTLKYDAFLHAFFLGFTFSMIFGHAPIIFPAILKIQMKYSARFYLHLALLHISVMIRVFSDITNNHDILKISGMLNAITILVFLLNTVSSIKRTNNDFIKQI